MPGDKVFGKDGKPATVTAVFRTENMILSRGSLKTGEILYVSRRYYAACQMNTRCYVVRWQDGSVTKPCATGIHRNADGILQII